MQLIYENNCEKIQNLLKKDTNLEKLFSSCEKVVINVNENYFAFLVETIISQQLSTKAANSICNKVNDFFNYKIDEDLILKTYDEDLRNLGLSYPKVKYLKSLAENIKNKMITFEDINQKSDIEIIDMLTKIKGIGVWSAQMFLMFSLGREDVFSILDLGLRRSFKKIYGDHMLEDIEKISLNWSPYRSIVSHYLWRFHE